MSTVFASLGAKAGLIVSRLCKKNGWETHMIRRLTVLGQQKGRRVVGLPLHRDYKFGQDHMEASTSDTILIRNHCLKYVEDNGMSL